jgi:hypothetical protein
LVVRVARKPYWLAVVGAVRRSAVAAWASTSWGSQFCTLNSASGSGTRL